MNIIDEGASGSRGGGRGGKGEGELQLCADLNSCCFGCGGDCHWSGFHSRQEVQGIMNTT